jgi:glycosyltransferase involved in cell wall biosynthesis
MVRAAGRTCACTSSAARVGALRRRVCRRVAESAGWVTLHEDLSRDALLALLARQRYGIHAMAREHFGIAVAEMARAGCIAFVPRGGGPAEIVGAEERLLFDSPEEAARQILATLGDRARRDALREHLARRAERYSSGRFVAELREIVRGFAPTP